MNNIVFDSLIPESKLKAYDHYLKPFQGLRGDLTKNVSCTEPLLCSMTRYNEIIMDIRSFIKYNPNNSLKIMYEPEYSFSDVDSFENNQSLSSIVGSLVNVVCEIFNENKIDNDIKIVAGYENSKGFYNRTIKMTKLMELFGVDKEFNKISGFDKVKYMDYFPQTYEQIKNYEKIIIPSIEQQLESKIIEVQRYSQELLQQGIDLSNESNKDSEEFKKFLEIQNAFQDLQKTFNTQIKEHDKLAEEYRVEMSKLEDYLFNTILSDLDFDREGMFHISFEVVYTEKVTNEDESVTNKINNIILILHDKLSLDISKYNYSLG